MAEETQSFAAHPLALLAAAFAAGILCVHSLAVPASLPIAATIFVSLLAVIALLISRSRIATLCLTCSFVCIGSTAALVEQRTVRPNSLKALLERNAIPLGAPVEVTGVLRRNPEISFDRIYFDLNVESVRAGSRDISASGVVACLMSRGDPTRVVDGLDLRYGARVRVMTLLERADEFRNPGVSPFTEFLDRRGYDASAFVRSSLLIERLDNTSVLVPLAWVYDLRTLVQRRIDATFSSETAGVLDAAVLGNRHTLSQPAAERFRQGGTFHVLVISGLHMTFLGGVVFFVAGRITRNRIIKFATSVLILWAYAFAVGAEASVVRAALMFTVALLAPLLARRASSLNLLGGVAIALLLLRPSDLFDPSFQLTFFSVLAIVVFAWPLLKRMSEIGSWRPTRESPYPPMCAQWVRTLCETLFWSETAGQRELAHANYSYRLFKSPLARQLERFYIQSTLRYAFAAVVVSISVQAVLAPFLIVYFHRLSISSIFLNIGVSVLMAVVIGCAAVALMLVQVSSSLAGPFIALTKGLNSVMVHSVDPFARIGMASIRLPEYSGLLAAVYVIYYVPLVFLIIKVWKWKPLELPTGDKNSRSIVLILLVQLLATVVIVAHPFNARRDGRLRVDFLDVGQGDCALITTPDGTTFLIDGGGRPGPFGNTPSEESDDHFEPDSRSIGEAVVSEYLWWRGLDRIDYVVATHADADHIDGLNEVVRNFSVRAALVARAPANDAEYAKFSQTLAACGVPVRLVSRGDVLKIDNVQFDVLWPSGQNTGDRSGNNASLVIRLRYGANAFLFTGDIESAAEKGLLHAGEELNAEVVKVPHHGSKTSSTQSFIAATSPQTAVISVGQTSIFGHPHKEVVERWKAAGAQVLITGKSGMITFSTDGNELKLESFSSNP